MTPSRTGLALVIALTIALTAGSASAHSPYYGETGGCTLGDGSFVQMRVMYEDGIFVADPASVLLIDADDYLLAHSELSQSLMIDPTSSGECRAFDLTRRVALMPDPLTFKRGPVPLRPDVDEQLWPIAYGDSPPYGFVERSMTVREAVRTTCVFAAGHYRRWSIFVGLGFFGMGALCFGVRSSPRTGRWWRIWRWLRLAIGLYVAASLGFLALAWWLISDTTFCLLVVGVWLGAAIMAAAYFGLRPLVRRIKK